MKVELRHCGVGGALRAAAAVLLTVLSSAVAAAPEAPPAEAPAADIYVHEDAVVTGKVMHTFTLEGETVNIIVGDFQLSVGKRTLSGRDAVMWIKERKLGPQALHDIQIYIEGKVRIVEADGTATSDERALVTLRQQGELRAKVDRYGEERLENLPVYHRALEERRQATSRPAPKLPPVVVIKRTTAQAKSGTQPAAKSEKPKEIEYQPVSFQAEEFESEEIADPMDPQHKLRVTIARGNVYLSQGDPDRDRFMEMRAASAVVYTSPEGARGQDVLGRIIGVYLEGDVVLRRGQRTVTGSRLFYDFQTGRALILESVMRMVQEPRDLPIYIRSREARQLSTREGAAGKLGDKWEFTDALVTTSDLYTPSYSIAAKRVYLQDTTPYDDEGNAVGPDSYRAKLLSSAFKLGAVPVLWSPYTLVEGERGHTALRSATFGHQGDFGWGVSTTWYLFRLLGVPTPPGVKGTLDLDVWQRGFLIGPKISYAKENYSGYVLGSYVRDNKSQDTFGTERQDVAAPGNRGRALLRHKQFLPQDWEMQVEASYLSDRNFLEQFYPDEYWTGKEQETLIYGKKQKDNWAFTALGKWRINDFLTQTEAYPDLAGHLIGQSLWQDRLTLYSEAHAGAVRYRPDSDSPETSSTGTGGDGTDGTGTDGVGGGTAVKGSKTTGRADTRQEIDVPLIMGPVKLLPFGVGRLSYWSDTPDESSQGRAWGEAGFTATTHIWRVYDQVENRLWDLHQIKHIMTPYGGLFVAGSSVESSELFPFSPDIERYVRNLSGGAIGLLNILQTKRGKPGALLPADWLRFDLYGAFFDDREKSGLPADGRYFWYRPEYSLPRDSVNANLEWLISDALTVLGDLNYDTQSGGLGRGDVGIAIVRDPRLRYYIGTRYIRDLNSNVGTFGFNYEINRKYTLSVFEQYDFKFDNGVNLDTSITLVRKFSRFYVGFTFIYDRSRSDVGLALSIWPEGIPEAKFLTPRMTMANTLTRSSDSSSSE